MKKQYFIPASIIPVVIVLDQLTKYLVLEYIGMIGRLDYFGGLLRITLVFNRGGVFGMFQGYQTVFLVVSIAVLALMISYYVFEKNKSAAFSASMSLIIAGAIGNIIDRILSIFFYRGGVVDFISVGYNDLRWPSFNIADSSIVVGACLLIIIFYIEEKKRKKTGSEA
jgi:signal peptidase II